jgi:Ca2+-binding EF-hand superfamily protein
MRSPYKSELAKAEEGDASLIYLTRDVFRELLAIEGSLEEVKKELALRPDFTLAGAFCKFSDNTHGRINPSEILFGFEKLGVAFDIADARLIVDRYDADKDGRLGFWEFSNALLPIQSDLRDDIERRRAIFDISNDTLDLLKKTFRKVIDAEGMLEGIRQRIQREKSVNLRQAFDSLDWLGRGFITDNEFKRSFENICERLGSPMLHQEIVVRIQDSIEMEAMIRRFNKDKLNGRISLPEFLEELTVKC